MKFPDFIILGAAKCGTTALWYNLNKHPDVEVVSKTTDSIEMNFWASGSIFWKKGIDWYKSRFPDSFCGEKSTMYYLKKRSMNQIKKHIPNVKLILCLRNPIDRGYSNYQMNYKSGKVFEFTPELFRSRYASDGMYMKHIKHNILPFFDKSQLYICITEKMKKDPTNEMNKVFDFLGVSHLDYSKKIVDGFLLRNRTRQEDIELNQKEHFYRVWSRYTKRMPIKEYRSLEPLYNNYNKELEDFLGYTIKEWRI